MLVSNAELLVTDSDETYLNEPGSSTTLRFGISIHDSLIQYQTWKSDIARMIETISIRSDGC